MEGTPNRDLNLLATRRDGDLLIAYHGAEFPDPSLRPVALMECRSGVTLAFSPMELVLLQMENIRILGTEPVSPERAALLEQETDLLSLAMQALHEASPATATAGKMPNFARREAARLLSKFTITPTKP